MLDLITAIFCALPAGGGFGMVFSQVKPRKPLAQVHRYAWLPVSAHVPPFLHGLARQSSTSSAQVEPFQPAAQVQR